MKSTLFLLGLAACSLANIIFHHAPLHCNLSSPNIYHGCFRGQECLKDGTCSPLDEITYPLSFRSEPVFQLRDGISTDGSCGPAHGNTICDPKSKFYTGGCCSQYGWCGNTPDHCGTGCISGCSSPPPALSGIPPRPDGRCGKDYGGAACDANGPYGGCCSQYGFCGKTIDHCLVENGCQNGCSDGTPTQGGGPVTSGEPVLFPVGGGSGGAVTTDGTCGATHGNTVCDNWPNGNCCSVYGFCGKTDGHCGAGCQSGNCVSAPATPAPGPSPAPAASDPGKFNYIGDSGVPAMHAALMPNGRVVFLDKLEDYSQLKNPNGHYAMSSEFDAVFSSPSYGRAVPLEYATNAFCSGGTFLADGRVISVGGNAPLTWLDPTIGDGFNAIRYLSRSSTDPSLNGQSWSEPGNKLASARWYATAQTMPDGTVFVASGSLNGLDPAVQSNNNPTYEILNRNGVSNGRNIPMAILQKNQPYYMYPFVHLLKDGNLFVFVAKACQLFNVESNTVVRELPGLPGDYRTYPNTGGSVLLPLSSKNGWEPEVLICGGGAYQDITSPTDPSCGRIAPLVPGSNWEMDSMPEGRGMVEGTLLPNGKVLWLNGGNRGAQGFGLMSDPTQQALLYDPAKPLGQRWETVASSTIPRLYHSVALLMQDGSVMVAGSNPVEMPRLTPEPQIPYLTEFRVEQYVPTYMNGGSNKYRPGGLHLSTTTIRADGSKFQLSFNAELQNAKDVKVVLYHGGFVTHSVHMGHRMLYLDFTGLAPGVYQQELIVSAPPNNNLAPPGPYMVFIVTDGFPSEGTWVQVV